MPWHWREEGLHGVNVCVSCEEAFSCLSAFDAHGDSEGDCRSPSEVGLVRMLLDGRQWVWKWPAAKLKRNDDNFYARDRVEVRH